MSATTPKPNGRARGPRVPLVAPVSELPAPEPPPAGGPTPNLDAAVLRVQRTACKLMRNADGQIGSRFYRYVTLDAVTDEVLPLLVEEDLLWKTFPTALDGEPALRYRMTHIPSGESDEDTMLLCCERTAQGQGSGETYARRYSLVAYLNLTVDPDDDGRGANLVAVDRYAQAAESHGSTIPAAQGQPSVNTGSIQGGEQGSAAASGAPAIATPQPQAAPSKPAGRPATVKQRNMLRAKAKGAGLSEGQLANVVIAANGELPRQWRSEEHASQALGRELDRLAASLVDAVIAGIAAEGSTS